jgi:muramoyltetrapeptide carboxypeptidase
MYKWPAPLEAGDRVGVVAPSLPLAKVFPERLSRGVKGLVRNHRLDVVVHEQVSQQQGFYGGDLQTRAQALIELIEAPEVKAILFSIGGFNSAELLDRIGPSLLRVPPKVVVGYSDNTALLLGIQALAGWTVFMGPSVMTQYAEHPDVLSYTTRSFHEVLFRQPSRWTLRPPENWTHEFLDWAGQEWKSRPRNPSGTGGFVRVLDGRGTGTSFGGNLETLNFLIGTPYLRVPDRIVLFFETTAEEAFLPRIARAITHLEQAGILRKAAAVLVGRSPDATPSWGVTLKELLASRLAPYGIPVVMDLPFGHSDPMATIPLGVECSVDVSASTLDIVFQR